MLDIRRDKCLPDDCQRKGLENMVVRSQHFQLIETSYVGVGAETDLLIWKLKAGYFQKCIHTVCTYACTDLFKSLYACGSTRDPKQQPKSQEKSPFKLSTSPGQVTLLQALFLSWRSLCDVYRTPILPPV